MDDLFRGDVLIDVAISHLLASNDYNVAIGKNYNSQLNYGLIFEMK